jgi:multidrug efflux pump subunit AcrB
MSIGKWSVDNPVLLNVLMVALVVLGTLSILRIPREQFSEVPFYWAIITVPYPGAAAADIEQSVTVPIENEMDGLKKLKQISSTTREGVAIVRVEFDDGISKDQFDRLFQEVQTRFNTITLPEGALDPVIDDFSSSDFLPVIEVILSGGDDEATLNRLALQLRDELLGVPEVEAITLEGDRERQYRIELDQSRAEALSVPLRAVAGAIQGRSGSIPGGTLKTPSREYIVRTDGEVGAVDDFNGLIIRQTSDGSVIRLEDIAVCHDTLDPAAPAVRYNGEQAISMNIIKEIGGNSIAVVNGVRQRIAAFEKQLPAGVAISFFNDSTVRIRSSISVLLTNAISGFILLVLILWVFLGTRNALMTALGIPLTFALTFLVLEFLDETLNSNSLFGLVLVLGLIVDHAIVIVENSHRLRQQGLSRREAAIAGVNEVVWPVSSATMTTVAAFLPLMILPGIIGRFFRVIPVVVSVALVVSTLEAFTFIPLHFAEWSRAGDAQRGTWFRRVERWFSQVFAPLYRKRYFVAGGGLLVMIVVFAMLGRVRQDLFSGEDYTYFYIDIEMPVGTPREKTSEFVAAYEEQLMSMRSVGEIRSVSSTIGQSEGGGQRILQNNAAQLVVDVAERGEGRQRPIQAVIDEVQETCAKIPGAESVLYRRVQGGPPVDPPISFRIFGNSYQDLSAIATRIKTMLAAYPELYNIDDDLERGTPELRIHVNRDRAAQYGLSVFTVGSYIRARFDGITATRIFDENEEVEIIVAFRRDAIRSVEQLTRLKIPVPSGQQVPFSAICDVSEENAIAAIKREEGKREVTVTAEAWDTKNIRTINSTMKNVFEWELNDLYPDVSFSVGGEFAEFSNILFQILRLFLIGIFLIYLILGAQFKSYIQPFLILFTVPFAFVGVILFLLVSGSPFSTTVLYAGVALAGIAVNDSIVLISFINERRKETGTVAEAVNDAVRVRLRPIVMTSVTTIAGLLPTAVGLGGYSPVWGPMASTIIFGLIFSTLTAVVAVPCLYGIIDDMTGIVKKRS